MKKKYRLHRIQPQRKQKPQPKNKLLSISHHRNGIGGAGFYVALFESPWVDWSDWPVVPKGPNKNVFQVIYFPSYEDEDQEIPAHYENIAVTNVALTSQGHISFFNNSWRGVDAWGEDMLDAVDKLEKQIGREFFRNQKLPQSQTQLQKQMKKRMRQTDKLQGRVQLKNKNVVITGTVPGKLALNWLPL